MVTMVTMVVVVAMMMVSWLDCSLQTYNNLVLSSLSDPNIVLYHGYWHFDLEKEALLVEISTPPECDYWNFQLDNWWMESMDYDHLPVVVTKHNAKLMDDGVGLRILISKR